LVFKSFHLKSSNRSFDQVWPKSKHWFLETRTLTEPWMVSNGKLMNTKFVPLIKTYIWSNGQIFICKSLNHLILNFERINSQTPVFGTLDGLDWKSHEYQYCSTHQDLHFIQRPFLHLIKCWQSVVENPQFPHIVHIVCVRFKIWWVLFI
jgi:hypothetical protein